MEEEKYLKAGDQEGVLPMGRPVVCGSHLL